jgi:hypothetical protein
MSKNIALCKTMMHVMKEPYDESIVKWKAAFEDLDQRYFLVALDN